MFRRKPILTHYQSPEASACPAEGGSFPVVFELAKGGVPSNVRAADGDASLPAAIPAAVANWRFEPASVDGKERAAEGRFTLECGASAPASPVFRIGGGTSVPSLVYKIEPEYSEAARQAKFSGAVLLSLVVNERGYPEQMRISHLTGLGLDRQAIEAVTLWRFRPALRDGKPVPTQAQIEVSFRLL